MNIKVKLHSFSHVIKVRNLTNDNYVAVFLYLGIYFMLFNVFHAEHKLFLFKVYTL